MTYMTKETRDAWQDYIRDYIISQATPLPQNIKGGKITMEDWTKIESEVWNPEEGQSISGVYLGVETEVGENKSNLYSVETEPGKQLGIWGCKVLDGKMLAVRVGQQVKIEFIGRVKPEKGKEYKSYNVFTKPVID